ncbi:MAG: hypothetical protein R6V83_07795 [Candidatus Thorarchaeota archaeon]
MKKIGTLLILGIIVLSVAYGVSYSTAQESGDPELNVSWQVVNETDSFEHTSQSSQWVFGPQPTFWLGYADNLTSIEENDFHVEYGTRLFLNITMPKSFLGEGNTLDTVRFWGSKAIEQSPVFVLEYNVTAGSWSLLSMDYESGSEEPVQSDFIGLYRNESSYYNDTEDYQVVFSIEFNDEVAEGIFWTGMKAVDDKGNTVSPSWLARLESGKFETPPIGLGVDVTVGQYALPEYYYAEVVNEAGEIIHYVDSHDNFTFRMRANEPFSRIEIPFAYLTNNSNYIRSYDWGMPKDMNNPLTGWDNFTYIPAMLTYVYNGAEACVALSYLDNISWTWSWQLDQWTVDYDLLINETADVSTFFYLKDSDVEHDGAWVSWTGYFTEIVDMNPWDSLKRGGTIKPDPYFWTALDSKGEPMQASADIADHNTVQLAYRDMYIEAFVRKDGVVVRRAQQGDILNMTMLVHAPAGDVNGSFYVEDYEHENIDGIRIHVDRQNLTVWMQASGRSSNSTHYWRHESTHSMTMNLKTNTTWSNSSITRWVYTRNHTFVGRCTEQTSTALTVLDHEFTIEEYLTTVGFDFRFEDSTPSMKIEDAGVSSGFRTTVQWNVTDGESWEWHPDPPDWDNTTFTDEHVQHLHDQIVWSPSHLLIGSVTTWQEPEWTVTDDGAIDLDGNVFTTDDQYFVKRTGYWHDEGNISTEGMWVGVNFDPTPSESGDEFHSNSWTGVATMMVEFSANESFHWYHASNFTPISSSEIQEVQHTMYADFDQEIAVPGYEWVAWLSKNRTIDLSEITGLDSNSWETSWFAWGTQQSFQVATDATTSTWAAFRAEYAGLLIFNDTDPDGGGPKEPNNAPDFSIEEGQVVTDEVTHLVLIDSINDTELRRPFGATNDTGDVTVSPDTEVTFGISIYDVEVSMYPLQVENSNGLRGPWAFRESYEGVVGLNSTDFDYWITHATVDEMAFDITFNVDMVEYNPDDETKWNHAVSFKVDQEFGNWSLDEFNNDVLEGRSLAVNFFGVLGTGTRTQYQAGDKPITDTNQGSVSADYYEYGADDSPFANVSMGGLPYTWGGDGHSEIYISGSSTAPIGAFSLMYESSSGNSVTQWQVDTSMLFMTAGYANWGGHEVICDPVFVSYSNAQQTGGGPSQTTTTPTTTTTPGTNGEGQGMLYVLVGGVVVVFVIVLVLFRRR